MTNAILKQTTARFYKKISQKNTLKPLCIITIKDLMPFFAFVKLMVLILLSTKKPKAIHYGSMKELSRKK